MTLSIHLNGQIDERSLSLLLRTQDQSPISTTSRWCDVKGYLVILGTLVSGVLHSPLSSFSSTLHVTSQKGGLRVTAWLLHTSISLSPLTFRLSEAVSLESHHDFPMSSWCFLTGKKAPDGLGCETNQSCQGTLAE